MHAKLKRGKQAQWKKGWGSSLRPVIHGKDPTHYSVDIGNMEEDENKNMVEERGMDAHLNTHSILRRILDKTMMERETIVDLAHKVLNNLREDM